MLDEAEECNIHIVTQRANNASAPSSLNIVEFSTSSCWNILACRFSSYEHAGYWTRCSMMISMGIISVECNIMLWRNMPENNDIGWHLYVVTIMSILGSASIRATSCAQDCVVTIHARCGCPYRNFHAKTHACKKACYCWPCIVSTLIYIASMFNVMPFCLKNNFGQGCVCNHRWRCTLNAWSFVCACIHTTKHPSIQSSTLSRSRE